MDDPRATRRAASLEATLGAYGAPARSLLVPSLFYKSVFLAEWFEELARQEDDAVRLSLATITRDTLREALELLGAMRGWESVPQGMEGTSSVVTDMRRILLFDLQRLKQGSAEAILLLAMRAPTAELRGKLLRLADLDRMHADELRRLLGAAVVPPVAHGEETRVALGAHAGRDGGGSLSRSIEASLRELRARGERPLRLVLSAAALRHLRDEGNVSSDGTALGLPADVDFGWRGECYAFVTDERVRLAELLAREGAPAPP